MAFLNEQDLVDQYDKTLHTEEYYIEEEVKLLGHNDRRSKLWGKIKDHLESKIAEYRVKNDMPMTEGNTIALRARIDELKEVISLGDEPIVYEEEDTENPGY